MKLLETRSLAVLAAGCAMLALGQSAQAQTIARTNYAQSSFNGGVGFSVAVVGENNGNPFSTSAGSFSTKIFAVAPQVGNNNDRVGALIATWTTYCVDLYENIGGVEEVNLSQQDGVLSKTITGGALDRNIGATAYIMVEATQGNGAIRSLLNAYTGVNGGASVQLEREAAIQLAIWEAAFDGIGTGLTPNLMAGNFRLNGSLNTEQTSVRNLATSILNAALASDGSYRQAEGTFLNFAPPDIAPPAGGGNRQDQIYAVPEPANLAAAFSALALLGVGAGIRRRKSN